MIKKQNIKLGFSLAILTAIMWGLVPIAMKFVLVELDPYTVAWFRFLLAFLGLTIWLAYKKDFPTLKIFKMKKRLMILIIAGLGLLGNFALFASGVQYLTATTSQVVAQLGIVIFMISTIFIFKERLRITQFLGIVILILGLILFFNVDLADLFRNFDKNAIGVWLTVSAACCWACYANAQKVLLKKLKAEQLLWLLYLISSLCLLPLSSPSHLIRLDSWQWIALIFCGLNTLIAYGALVAAMEYWQASEVSAVTTLTPLFSLIFADLFALLIPAYFEFQALNLVEYIGAVTVVFGAMFATIGHKIWSPRKGFHFSKKGIK